jgi:hypothetical protein
VSKTVNSRPKRDAVETVLAMSDKVGAHSNGGVAVPPQSITKPALRWMFWMTGFELC